MNFQTVVPELFHRFPKLEASCHARFACMKGEEPDPYTVFGSILVPALAAALETGDLAAILKICAFLEDVSVAAASDNNLVPLLNVEIGEWLGGMANEERLTPWLGAETKRVCNYVEGLATQRLQLKAETDANTLFSRIRARLRRSKKT